MFPDRILSLCLSIAEGEWSAEELGGEDGHNTEADRDVIFSL